MGHPPAGSAQASGETVSHGQQESGERVAGGGALSALLKHWQDYYWGNDRIPGAVGCVKHQQTPGPGRLLVFWSFLKGTERLVCVRHQQESWVQAQSLPCPSRRVN